MKVQETIQREILGQRMDRELENMVQRRFQKSLAEAADEEIYEALLSLIKGLAHVTVPNEGTKKVYYLSAEFMVGRLIANNLVNLGVYEKVETALQKSGKSLAAIVEREPEPSLGGGGLGRLAACFLDSMASLGLPGAGIGVNYHFGLFRQEFADHLQCAQKDGWIRQPSWLDKTDVRFPVCFGDRTVMAKMYDIDVIGYKNGVNRLHLFDVEGVDETLVQEGIRFDKTDIERNLTLFLYPDDSDEAGRLLRVYQQYFMASTAAQFILQEMKERQYDLRRMYDYAVIQINDTHPALVIPELIRILIEKKAFTLDEAAEVVQRTCAYTNHTILVESPEKWPLEWLKKAVPQLVPILCALSDRVAARYADPAVQIIDENGFVHMANLAIHYGFSVNGPAAIHTELIKQEQLRAFYQIYPEKFNNKTNGISFRRWLLCCNRELAALIDDTIGKGYRTDAGELKKLRELSDEQLAAFLPALETVKQKKKEELAACVLEREKERIDPASIFDIQIKPIHEYKRQQLNALYIIHKYLEIKGGKRPARPLTFLFGGKASTAYVEAQDIIHLILVLQEIVNHDPDVKDFMKVVMVRNYNVSYAEKLIPACDISEQISLASKEASGTANMKLMLNGAVTLGTLDGSTAEIYRLVGEENIYLFGQTCEQVCEREKRGDYAPRDCYEKSAAVRETVDFITGRQALAVGHEENLRRMRETLLERDRYMTLLDLEDYIAVKDRMLTDYEDREKWRRMMLVNVAEAGFFSSDRTVAEYNRDIWKLE